MSESSERLVRMKERLLQTEILCQCPDLVNETASDYIAGLMRGWYSIDEDGQFVQTDSTPLRTQDFKPMAVDEIGEYLRLTHPYLFKPSRPTGSSTAQTKEPPPPALSRDRMSVAEKVQFIRQHGQQSYLSLPETATAALPLAERPRSTWTAAEKADYVHRFGMDAYLALPA